MTKDKHGAICGGLVVVAIAAFVTGALWGLGEAIYANREAISAALSKWPGWAWLSLAGFIGFFAVVFIGNVTEPRT